ncbi:actinodin1 isoform X1 [Anguilla rostrata]|uniref:actinodin1 isoform X1 n=1 Tax=Anguilla rostrata TaxID=7938 RepID=UPI0030D2D789
MARAGEPSFSLIFAGVLLVTASLPDFLGAGPVGQRQKGDAGETMLVRHKRNISWYKQHSDFWNWYKYFTDTGNSKGVEELDRVYLTYLQNKNRAEGRRSYKLYLRHLGDIYKSCAESDDPDCVASYTSRPKPTPKPEPPKPAPIKMCDPYRDPYCLFSMMYPKASIRAPAPIKAPAPVKAPAPILAPVVPARSPASGYYYYAPIPKPFLSAQQKAELLRICDTKDVECLQYHLRAAYGYTPSAGPAPSYAHLGCDPKKDPNCTPQLVQKAPSGMFYRYPTCDPTTDPYCLMRMHQAAQNQQPAAPPAGLKRPCNPLLDKNCNPLTATRLVDLSQYMQTQEKEKQQDPQDEPAPAYSAACDPRYDPYCQYRAAAAAMMRRPPAPAPPPAEEPLVHPRLGVRGKTKEGYDCYMGYDEECLPLPRRRATESRPSARGFGFGFGVRPEEPYEPHLNTDGTRNGVIEPDPDCDPEYDSNCRLRRYEAPAEPQPAAPAEEERPQEQQMTEEHEDEPDHHEELQHQEEPYQEEPHHQEDPYGQAPGYEQHHYEQQPEAPSYDQQHYEPYQSGQEDPYASYSPQDQPGSQPDGLGGYGDQYPGYDDGQDHRSYTGEYRKK